MKKYVFFTHAIGNMGGAQIYIRNKLKVCKKLGYSPYVFFFSNEEIYIDDLKQYSDFYIKELGEFPFLFNRKTVDRTLHAILEKIEFDFSQDELLIEANTKTVACWGEILARLTLGKNFVYLLGETFLGKSFIELRDFWDFKLERREIAFIDSDVARDAFAPWKDLRPDQCYFLRACCTNSVEDVPYPEKLNAFIGANELNVGIIGRIEKRYVIEAVREMVKYAQLHPRTRIGILLIGDGTEAADEEIKSVVDPIENVSLEKTGYVYPIPFGIIHKMNFCVGSAGCAWASFLSGKITISMDFNGRLLGIIGYDTIDSLCSDTVSEKTFGEYIDLILNKSIDISRQKISFIQEYEEETLTHFRFLEQSCSEKKYYDMRCPSFRSLLKKGYCRLKK